MALAATLLFAACAAPPRRAAVSRATFDDPALRVEASERAQETSWLTGLGLSVPAAGVVRERPWDLPLGPRSFVVPTAWYRAPPPTRVNARALRGDLGLLRLVVERAYGGYAPAAARGWAWDAWFDRWDRSLAAQGEAEFPMRQALAPWEELMAFQLDNHSGAVVGEWSGSLSRSAMLASEPTGSCTATRGSDGRVVPLRDGDPAQQPRRAWRFDAEARSFAAAWYVSFPSRRGAVSALQCGGAWVDVTPAEELPWAERTANVRAVLGAERDVPAWRVLEAGVGYLRLPSFTKQNTDRLEALAPSLPASLDDLVALVVDLRSNAGGDAPLWLFSRWLGDATVTRLAEHSVERRRSCLHDSLRWGYTQETSRDVHAPLARWVGRMLRGGLATLFQPGTSGCPDTLERERASENYRDRRFDPLGSRARPLMLLVVDAHCASDCEYLAASLAKLPNAVVVGTNSGGVGEFIQPGYFVLPRTRLPFRVALGHSDIYGDGRSFDGYGLDVDVLLPTAASQSPRALVALARALVH